MTVHPHACGEHGHKKYNDSQMAGSSPRLWGTHQREITMSSSSRFIPTPVGNTSR
ncbi:hypothetical protein D1AOALGA4SA_11472 [Olavius algarvensis Delta 1 endosymbiont]|nr:hypothetical protein D1AOALGA4SA_11472 [Olavius algarvensis Delta 1 endosymbiont]